MPKPKQSVAKRWKKSFSNTQNPEERRLEYEERQERLRAVLMQRRAANATTESAPRNDDTTESALRNDDTNESAPQDDLNDMSNHENEPSKP
jgi:hypothetical protein